MSNNIIKKAQHVRWLQFLPDALTAEALAARAGLELAGAAGYDKIVLEVDNLGLVHSLNSDNGDRSSISGIIQDIREICRGFTSFECVFVRREANGAAHACARLASTNWPVRNWVTALPISLMEVVNRDCNMDDD